MKTVRTSTEDHKIKALFSLLDQELHGNYGDYQETYAPQNQFKAPIKAVLIMEQDQAIACGAFKEFSETKEIEIKRMFVRPEFRGKGISKIVLHELENWAVELGFQKAMLETGTKQVAALHLYEKTGYQRIPCYEPYVGFPESICMGKALSK